MAGVGAGVGVEVECRSSGWTSTSEDEEAGRSPRSRPHPLPPPPPQSNPSQSNPSQSNPSQSNPSQSNPSHRVITSKPGTMRSWRTSAQRVAKSGPSLATSAFEVASTPAGGDDMGPCHMGPRAGGHAGHVGPRAGGHAGQAGAQGWWVLCEPLAWHRSASSHEARHHRPPLRRSH